MTDVVLRPPGPDGAGDVALAPAHGAREPFDYEAIPAGYLQLAALLDAHGLVEPRVEPYLFAAPFAAAVGWTIVDRVARLERRAARRAGMLLLATAVKPA